MFSDVFIDRKFKLPRAWSNQEIAKFAPAFSGDIVNVSAWQDRDKQGRTYESYFKNAGSYSRTNYKAEAMGFQGEENEIFLDLTGELPKDLRQKFDLVFNHTVLEHIFEVDKAFENLCTMSRDAVMIVVPFVQQMHAEYGDYWRFTPTCLQKMFEKNGFTPVYLSYNGQPFSSVYIFVIAARDPQKWQGKFENNCPGGQVPFLEKKYFADQYDSFVGTNAMPSILHCLYRYIGGMKAKLTGQKQGDEA
jgi:hypothetical protein